MMRGLYAQPDGILVLLMNLQHLNTYLSVSNVGNKLKEIGDNILDF